MRWRPETGKMHWIHGFVASDVAMTPVSHGGAKEGYGDTVEALSHAAQG
jgi:hypothetical protein